MLSKGDEEEDMRERSGKDYLLIENNVRKEGRKMMKMRDRKNYEEWNVINAKR